MLTIVKLKIMKMLLNQCFTIENICKNQLFYNKNGIILMPFFCCENINYLLIRLVLLGHQD